MRSIYVCFFALVALIGLITFAGFLYFVMRSTFRLIRQQSHDVVILSAIGLFVYSLISISFSGRLVTATPFWMACSFILMLERQHNPVTVSRRTSRNRLLFFRNISHTTNGEHAWSARAQSIEG